VPHHAKIVFGNDLKRYRSWRRNLFDLLTIAYRRPLDGDDWSTLLRIARLLVGQATAQRLYHLRQPLPPGTRPQDVTRHQALACDRALPAGKRNGFRNGAALLDRLARSPIVQEFGLAPTEPVGRFPDWSCHMTHEPLPPRLRAEYDAAPIAIRAALPFVWRIGVMAGVFDRTSDLPGRDLFGPETCKISSLSDR
jgi:hypothetical protein